MSKWLLEINKLTLRFGGLTAVEDVDLQVAPAEIVAVIGPNGAGKTSVFNAISGIYEPTSGSLSFGGEPLRRPLRRRHVAGVLCVGLWLGLCFLMVAGNVNRLWDITIKQNSQNGTLAVQQIWPTLRNYFAAEPRLETRQGRTYVVSYDGETTYGSVRTREAAESKLAEVRERELPAQMATQRIHAWVFILGFAVGVAGSVTFFRQTRRTASWIARQGIARTFQNNRLFHNMTVIENVRVALDGHVRGSDAVQIKEARELLQFVGLATREQVLARELPYGEKRLLEIARALATRPRLLLLDEPAAGMNATETRALMELIRSIRARGIAIMLIEHDMKMIMGISDRIAVLEHGRKIADNVPDEVRRDPKVVAAYLGQEEAAC